MNFYAQNTNNFLLIIQSNSPGEVSNWVLPFLTQFKKEVPDSDVIVFLTPCQYASNKEETLLKNSHLISRVVSPKKSIKHIRSLPFKINHPYKKGATLFLGGDPFFSVILSKKYSLPCYGYSNSNRSLGFGYTKSLLKSDVGDLMSEKVNQFLESHPTPPKKTIDILFFTGSRPQHFKAFFPIVVRTIKELKKQNKKLHIALHISPFITEDLIKQVLSENPTETPITQSPSLEIMSKSKLLITLAGTNTAEALYLNLPMIVLFPLNFPELVILDGLAGLLSKIPIIGPLIKRLVLVYLRKTVRYVSQPNRLTNKEIVPEYIGIIDPKKLANKAALLIENKKSLHIIKTALKEIPFPKQVASDIIKEIIK